MSLKRRARVEGNESPKHSESKSFLALQESVVLMELRRVAFFPCQSHRLEALGRDLGDAPCFVSGYVECLLFISRIHDFMRSLMPSTSRLPPHCGPCSIFMPEKYRMAPLKRGCLLPFPSALKALLSTHESSQGSSQS